jgi:hypothetical protein
VTRALAPYSPTSMPAMLRSLRSVPGTPSAARSTILRSTPGWMSSLPRSAGSASGALIDRDRGR